VFTSFCLEPLRNVSQYQSIIPVGHVLWQISHILVEDVVLDVPKPWMLKMNQVFVNTLLLEELFALVEHLKPLLSLADDRSKLLWVRSWFLVLPILGSLLLL
jgi:hypothetical protein